MHVDKHIYFCTSVISNIYIHMHTEERRDVFFIMLKYHLTNVEEVGSYEIIKGCSLTLKWGSLMRNRLCM